MSLRESFKYNIKKKDFVLILVTGSGTPTQKCQFRGLSSPGGLILSQDVMRETSQIRVYVVRPLRSQEIIRENFIVTTVHRAHTARSLSHTGNSPHRSSTRVEKRATREIPCYGYPC
ncbi:hypothetical protein AVEN_105736-1 [Araneus ventricosus]|uniref:Uncharacterized protein n=1 Tax=Araneus ventricosus TaxID=182803 RepID=A0A4Y2QMD9_ARAVE|nr:hypothetical protein AVEN_105736-1 [Araneus ventricosus]